MADEESSSRLEDVEQSNKEGADIVADTIYGVPTTNGVGSRQLDPRLVDLH